MARAPASKTKAPAKAAAAKRGKAETGKEIFARRAAVVAAAEAEAAAKEAETPKRKSKTARIVTQEAMDYICSQIVAGRAVGSILEDSGMPDKPVFYGAIARSPDFKNQYLRAKTEMAHAMSDEIQSIMDEAAADVDAEGKPNSVAVQRARLRVDGRRWLLSKLMPKVYGDRSKDAGDEDPGTVKIEGGLPE